MAAEPAADHGIRTLCTLPDGAVPLEVVEVCGYLDADGNRCWTVRYGDVPLSTTLGLLRIAEHDVMHEATTWPID